MIATETPLRTKVITDDDITGFCVVDHGLLKKWKDKPLVIWTCHENPPQFDWMVVDIADTTLQDGLLYLVDLDGAKARRAWFTPKGALILEPASGNNARPVAFWGRQKDRVEVLGRVIVTSTAHE
jgi:hypothetical protein